MKILPVATTLACAILLIGCGRQGATESDAERQEQEQLAEEKNAQLLSALHERDAALDERQRLLDQREKQLAAPLAVGQGPQTETPAQAGPLPVAAGPSGAAGAVPDATYQEFYDALSAYGSWVQIPGYDWVWQPSATVQDSNWRPYTLGHWVYTDDGWTWVSTEPFGWITYHYGRWMRTHTLGWVWVPGDQWAPAWVSWRYGDNFVGWSPLPPEAQLDNTAGIQRSADEQYNLSASDYVFIPASEFGEGDMAVVEAPPDEIETIYDNSDNVTNIYYDSGAYAIVCYGPDYDFMRGKSRRPLLPPLKLARGGFGDPANRGGLISGNTLHIPAPHIVKPKTPAAPRHPRGTFADTRLITPHETPPPPIAPPPQTVQAPRVANNPPASPQPRPDRPFANQSSASGLAVPMVRQPNAIQQSEPSAAVTQEPPPPPPGSPLRETRLPAEPNSPPANADSQNARDATIIEQQQVQRAREEQAVRAADQAQQAEAAQVQRAEEARAEQAALGERAAAAQQAAEAERAAVQQEAAQVERQQAAAQAEAVRSSQPSYAPSGGAIQPAGTQPGANGRNQQ